MENYLKTYNLGNINNKKELLEFIFNNPSKVQLSKLNVKIFKEKRKDSNPYYSYNDYLNSCTAAVKDIFNIKIFELTDIQKEILNQTKDEDIIFLVTNLIFKIENFNGGHRNKEMYDTEINFITLYSDAILKEYIEENISRISQKYDVKYLIR